ncbi:MAG TPA: hypothetical protein VIF60_14680 [Burkholderiaceae bacterium]|jgi:hypothetical protein
MSTTRQEFVVDGVGTFQWHDDHWECSPAALAGAVISIDSIAISADHQARAVALCLKWHDVIAQCLAYIELRRKDYELEAVEFNEPDIFIDDDDEWTVYFGTEEEFDLLVGVEFRGDEPFQLIIGD